MSRPNIIVIVADDMPMDSLDHMPYLSSDPGGSWLTFSQGIITSPICAPSRFSMFAGRYARTVGVSNNDEVNEAFHGGVPQPSLVAPALKRAGYHTAHVGKYQNHWPWTDFGGAASTMKALGWDDWRHHTGGDYFDYSFWDNGTQTTYDDTLDANYVTDQEFARAVDIVENTREPFFLHMGLRAPHGEDVTAWPPAPRHEALSITVTERDNYDEADVSDKPTWLTDYRPNQMSTQEKTDLAAFRLNALRQMRSVDEGIEDVIDALTSRGILDDTYLFFYGDNGYCFGEHRYFTKAAAFEECINMHLKVRWPGQSDTTYSDLVANIDLAPTWCDLAGVQMLTDAPEGQSIVPLVDHGAAHRDAVLLQRDAETPTLTFKPGEYTGIRTATHKYVSYANGDTELYDLSTDPYELSNLAGTGLTIETTLAAKMATLVASAGG